MTWSPDTRQGVVTARNPGQDQLAAHTSATHDELARAMGQITANSPVYNDIPETQGTARNKGIVAGGRDREDEVRLTAYRAQKAREAS
jgi:hypothetical protein